MWNFFEFYHHGNPYITKTNAEFFRIVCKYDITQRGEHHFYCENERHAATTRAEKKSVLRSLAIEWQALFNEQAYSWEDVIEWQAFFEEYGKKYGLIKEFRENGII
jgi:hypothetical protein